VNGKETDNWNWEKKMKLFFPVLLIQPSLFAVSQGARKKKMSHLTKVGREPDWNGRRKGDKGKEY